MKPRLRRGQGFGWVGKCVTRWPWPVIGVWLAVPAALFLAFPPLSDAIKQHPVPLVPPAAPAMITEHEMTQDFRESGSDNLLLVVLTDESGLTRDDEQRYAALVQALRDDSRDVRALQEFVSTPAMREVLTSKDHKAWILPIGLAGGLDSPEGYDAHGRVADIVASVTRDTALQASLTGPSATIVDLTDVGDRDMHDIEIATGLLVLLILAAVYRNPRTMMLPLITIGLSLLTARGVVAGLSQLGLGVCNETVILMTAMIAGAGTDYAVFMISRYHEELRTGVDSDAAVALALAAIGKVVVASGATVAVTFLCMSFARLGLLSTVGPALAVSVAVAVLGAFTLLPAILILTGRRGWINPRQELTARVWSRLGRALVARPSAYLVASVAVLAVLATCGLFVQFNWDESKTLPGSTPSNRGYAALSAHFPLNGTIPQYLVVRSPHDLRTARSLSDLEQMAFRISQISSMSAVLGITRPTGQPPEQATVAYQAGEVGAQLQTAASSIQDNKANLGRLNSGAQELANTLAGVREEVSSAVAGASDAVSILDDPRIREARAQLRELTSDGSLDQLSAIANQLPQTPETQEISATVRSLHSQLRSAVGGLQSMGISEVGSAQAQLSMMQNGANELAAGSHQLADGVGKLIESTNKIGDGLATASSFLLSLKHEATDSRIGGFYLPPQALTDDADLRRAAEIFVSPDGHTVRYLIQSALNPFSTEAMDQVNEITEVSHRAQPNTELVDAAISMTGFPAVNRDLRNYYDYDLHLIMAATLLVVFLILCLLLRAIVAPLHLIVSVVISYLSALGVGVVAFQFIGGQHLSWSVPGMAFIVLVAVGADYNMLLMSRVRDESPDSVSAGVIKTVSSTGGVITSAGLIFAASMFGLLFGSIDGMVQSGFIIGVGLLIDTFLVRTITVPALAVLIGRANWWPTLWGRRAIPLHESEGEVVYGLA